MLDDMKADVNARVEGLGRTLSVIARCGRCENVQLLIEHDADVDAKVDGIDDSSATWSVRDSRCFD